MKADDGIDVGAAARQLQHVASAETKPHCRFLAAVANTALVRLGYHSS